MDRRENAMATNVAAIVVNKLHTWSPLRDLVKMSHILNRWGKDW
jgi:hypothetical protein